MKHLAYILTIFILSTLMFFLSLLVIDHTISSVTRFPVSLLLGYPCTKLMVCLLLSFFVNILFYLLMMFKVKLDHYRQAGKLRQVIGALFVLVFTGFLSVDSTVVYVFNRKTTPLLHLPRSIILCVTAFLLHHLTATYIVNAFRRNIQKTIYRIFRQPPDFFEWYDRYLPYIISGNSRRKYKKAKKAFQQYTGEYIYLPLKEIDEPYLEKLKEKMSRDVQKGILTNEDITRHMECYQQVLQFAQSPAE